MAKNEGYKGTKELNLNTERTGDVSCVMDMPIRRTTFDDDDL